MLSYAKPVTFFSQALRDSARDEPCVCHGRIGTTVWAHSNEPEHGKSMGKKAHDLLGNYLCQESHDLYDGRIGDWTREEKRAFFRECYPKTMVRVAEKIQRGELKLVAKR